MEANIKDHADSGWDDYSERVLRNEGRLEGLETLVAETRESDRKLIEQRSESLARELERRAEALLELVTARADAVLSLSKEEREADRREVATWVEQHQARTVELRDGMRRESDMATTLLRELYDASIADIRTALKDGLDQNLAQSHNAIHELELRRTAETTRLEQMVRQWRDSDREARELFATETARHLDQLNHNNERMAAFQANSVTRELWQSEKDATMSRESTLRDQIVAIDRTLLTMTPTATSDKSHREMAERMEATLSAATKLLDTKIAGLDVKVEDLKASRDTTSGKSQGAFALYGLLIGGISVIVAVVVMVNALLSR